MQLLPRPLPFTMAFLIVSPLAARAAEGAAENAEAEKESAMLPAAGLPEVKTSKEPVSERPRTVWTIAADARLDSVALGEAEASLGLGLRYQTPRADVSTIVRRGSGGNMASERQSRDLGALLLAPNNSSLGASSELQVYWNSGVYCQVESALSNKCDWSKPPIKLFQYGAFALVNVGQTKVDVAASDSAPALSTTLVPVHVSAGLAVRTHDTFVVNDVEYPIALTLLVGPSFRSATGDASPELRESLLASNKLVYWGIDLAFRVQIASATLGTVLSIIPTSGDDRVAGLTSTQVTPFVTFSLPFSIAK